LSLLCTPAWATCFGAGAPIDIVRCLDAGLENSQVRIAELEAYVDQLEALLAVDGDGDLVLTGANLRIENGLGSTDSTNGKGNLILGYNEGFGDRSGSHNAIIGVDHEYSSYAGLVAGRRNEVNGPYASVTGGIDNVATGSYAVVVGGRENTAEDLEGVAVGGWGNTVGPGLTGGSVILGGRDNTTDVNATVIVGGRDNLGVGLDAVIVGGADNETRGQISVITGGEGNFTSSLDVGVVIP